MPLRQADAALGTKASIAGGKTDEFASSRSSSATIRVWTPSKDSALHFNFRPNRARELTRALATDGFTEFARTAASKPYLAWVPHKKKAALL